jgi:outer membrane protein assembly factor BamD
MTIKKILLTLGLLLFVACANKGDELDLSGIAEGELYSLADEEFQSKNYSKAASLFRVVVDEYPFSALAAKAQIMEAYSYYLGLKFIEAEVAIEEFLTLFPGNENTEWAYFLKSIIYYDQILVVKLDQEFSVKAKESITEYLNRYPNGKYVKDLTLKLDLVNEHLAGKEMLVAKYYQDNADYVAAINRYQDVFYNYSTTSHIQEALYRLSECYYILGIESEAKKYAAVLGHNYPASKWYNYAYNIMRTDATKN